jgi:hypothetical protein
MCGFENYKCYLLYDDDAPAIKHLDARHKDDRYFNQDGGMYVIKYNKYLKKNNSIPLKKILNINH